VQGSDSNFYGTTANGGTSQNGTVFRISPSGIYTNLYSFSGIVGSQPSAGLVQGSDGNFYGTTTLGGVTNQNPFDSSGYGTVFKFSPVGTATVLYSFTGGADGGVPLAGLVQGSDSNFYGTTEIGGTSTNCRFGCGTVFKISPAGTLTTLYTFSGANGANPTEALAQGSDGNFYGTTQGGGMDNEGTMFKISSAGTLTTLYSFPFGLDNLYPYAGLVQGSDGNFYGTTQNGGTNGVGSVYKISPAGTLTNLYSFSRGANGYSPVAGLVEGSDGSFYGTTEEGGTSSNGTVFKISPAGTLTLLYSFSGGADGREPQAGLVQGSDGSFYGTTYIGGTTNVGTVFRLTVPLEPPPYPINQITGVRVSDTNVIVNIPSIEGETYQLQFSSSMNPTNWVNEGGTITSIGSVLTLTNFGGALGSQGFYRFAITP
jgi:uncharacterized repeat protein (TIGR03803 family)